MVKKERIFMRIGEIAQAAEEMGRISEEFG